MSGVVARLDDPLALTKYQYSDRSRVRYPLAPGDENRAGCHTDLTCMEILRAARRLIEDPRRYTSANSHDGLEECGAWQAKCYVWSLVGAIFATFPGGPYPGGRHPPNAKEWDEAVHRVRKVSGENAWDGSHEAALKALDAAISLVVQ